MSGPGSRRWFWALSWIPPASFEKLENVPSVPSFFPPASDPLHVPRVLVTWLLKYFAMWDIVIAVAQSIVAGIGGLLGVYVTFRPPKSAVKRRRYLWGFFIIMALSVVLISIQAKRSTETTNKVDSSLQQIVHNTTTSRHTYIDFSDPLPVRNDPYLPFRVGGIPNVAIQYMSAGGYPATNVLSQSKLVLVEDPTLADQEESAFAEFTKRSPAAAGGTLPAYSQSKRYNTITLDTPLTAEEVARLNENSLHLCALARIFWTDETGQYCTLYFRCGVKDITNNFVVFDWRNIGVAHNREQPCQYEVRRE